MQEQRNKQFYISDWHYGHANVIAFDNRPFKSLLEMDEALVDRWNAVVSPGDIVYVLGDILRLTSTKKSETTTTVSCLRRTTMGS